jgi:hypothetical protein
LRLGSPQASTDRQGKPVRKATVQLATALLYVNEHLILPNLLLPLMASAKILSRLRHELWGFESMSVESRLGPGRKVRESCRESLAYKELYDVLLHTGSLVSQEDFSLDDSSHNLSQVLRLVKVVQCSWDLPVDRIKSNVASGQPACLRKPSDVGAVRKALDFAVRLWLFIPLRYDNDRATLTELLSEKLEKGQAQSGSLSLDFSAINLVRKAGITLKPTSDLSAHLQLEWSDSNRCVVHVFRHAKAIRLYQEAAHRYRRDPHMARIDG